MTKKIFAVAPYDRGDKLNFKMAPFLAWKQIGGRVANSRYPWRPLHRFAYSGELPILYKSKHEARLRFVEPVSMSFDTFPDYARYEVVPMMWDVWPQYYDKVAAWFKKHHVRTAIISSSINAEATRKLCPEVNIMFCPEAINTEAYGAGLPLAERPVDLLEMGRTNDKVIRLQLPDALRHERTVVGGKFMYTNDELRHVLGQSKVTIALPRSITDPAGSGGVETMTQRYWECMLSRMVMVGHAPHELIDLVGYNPVIEIDYANVNEQIADIVAHIADYQELVDRNRATALRLGDWKVRMRSVMEWLGGQGYEI